MDIYFGTIEEFVGSLACTPHAFTAASTIAALHHGEERVAVEGRDLSVF